ncbi:hypothetical protein ABZ788_39945, partial [Streptomyces tendae]
MLVHRGHHRIERRSERPERLIQATAHPQPLRTLPRKHKGGTPGRTTPGQGTAAGCQGRQALHQLIPVPAHHHRAVVMDRTARRQGEAHIHRGETILLPDLGQQPLRLHHQRIRRLRRHHPRHH